MKDALKRQGPQFEPGSTQNVALLSLSSLSAGLRSPDVKRDGRGPTKYAKRRVSSFGGMLAGYYFLSVLPSVAAGPQTDNDVVTLYICRLL